ncbi:MAG: phage integrase N-terminal SAM-like domain-containing protein [Desulfobacterales bacterium]|nr:phage integrase N-terminal SAM-like domain-containing protein [Desulfobacterales bacterium]
MYRACRSIREAIRRKHYSIRTKEAYVAWIKRYILFHNKRHLSEMETPKSKRFSPI